VALTQEQIKDLKAQLEEQISHLPPEKRAEAQKQIDSLSQEALETMLEEQRSSNQKTIFRMIIDKEVPSVSIAENDHALAVLEINPISKGHTIIIPKSSVKEEKSLSKEVHSLSEQLSKKLISSLKAKSTSVVPEKKFGEVILNIIPIYDKPLNLESPRIKSSVAELEKLKLEINVEKIENKPEKIKIEKKSQEEVLKLKRRIP